LELPVEGFSNILEMFAGGGVRAKISKRFLDLVLTSQG
jgi:hypothetical protein